MGIAERREREKHQRMESIVDAAESLIFSKGLDNTTMDEIADKSELSKGTLYLYFKNKDELLLAIINRAFEVLNTMFEDAYKEGGNGLQKTSKIGEAFMRFATEYSHYNNLMMHSVKAEHFCEPGNVYFESIKLKDKSIDILIQAIDDGIKDGSIKESIDPVKTAFLLWGESMGLMQLIHQKGEMIKASRGIDPNTLYDYFFEFTNMALSP